MLPRMGTGSHLSDLCLPQFLVRSRGEQETPLYQFRRRCKDAPCAQGRWFSAKPCHAHPEILLVCTWRSPFLCKPQENQICMFPWCCCTILSSPLLPGSSHENLELPTSEGENRNHVPRETAAPEPAEMRGGREAEHRGVPGWKRLSGLEAESRRKGRRKCKEWWGLGKVSPGATLTTRMGYTEETRGQGQGDWVSDWLGWGTDGQKEDKGKWNRGPKITLERERTWGRASALWLQRWGSLTGDRKHRRSCGAWK